MTTSRIFQKVPVQAISKVVSEINKFKSNNIVEGHLTVYAVFSPKERISFHFPDLNLTELNKLYPADSNGIRIYYAQNGNDKHNYLLFTEPSKSGNSIPNDLIGSVYLISGEFRSYNLSHDHGHKHLLTDHFSCEPDCPEFSILNMSIA